MSPRSLPAILASTVALAVAAGPLAVSAHAAGDDGNGSFASSLPPKTPSQDDPKDPSEPKDPKDPKDPDNGPKGPQQGPGDALEGSYAGELVTTQLDVSNKPTAQPATAYELPFQCGETWTGTTRSSHSPSVRSVDFNRSDDLGDPVVAAAAGVVTTAVTGKNRPGYGQFVVVDHGNDESTLYAHLDSVTVTVGQAVSAGTQVGTVGNTGNSYGAHLHFEERKGSSVVDSWFHGARYVYGTAQASENCGEISIPDVPLAGNVVGNKRADLVVFRRTATPAPAFYVRRERKAEKVIPMGTSSDQPVLGDWDGNGKANPGVRHPGSRTFKLKVGRKVTEIRFGGRSDLAIVGDWDGDGHWDVGTRRATRNLFRLRAADGTVTKVRLGDIDDLPVTGDWDGDGDTDLGVYDSATATFTLRQVDDTGMEWLSQVALGAPGYLPVVGDWDANGVTDLGVWDPDTASFSMRKAPTPTKKGKARIVRSRFGNGR
jgi:murein DD-endopeptidase MepM/ murein hydrolase activator NlpD